MKKTAIVTTTESNVHIPVHEVEHHVNNMHHPDHLCGAGHLPGYENISWCSEETEAKGTVEIACTELSRHKKRYVLIPVETSFWVVCTKANALNYKVTWNCSLS